MYRRHTMGQCDVQGNGRQEHPLSGATGAGSSQEKHAPRLKSEIAHGNVQREGAGIIRISDRTGLLFDKESHKLN